MLIGENKNYQKILLLALFLGALILRLFTIGSPLAGDEAITFNHYAHLNFSELLLNYYDSNQHSFFSILSNFCLLIFGDHEVSFRLPSLIAGVLAIPLAYYTCRSLGLPLSFLGSSTNHLVFNDVEVIIPEKSTRLIKSFGSFQVFEWDMKLSRMAPGNINLDYESQVVGLKGEIETYAIEDPSAVGDTSLLINNSDAPPTIFIVFPPIFDIDMGGNEGFLLNLFLKAPRHRTLFRTVMVNSDTSKIPSAYLNPYLNPNHSDFESKLSVKKWEIVVLLSSIGRGKRMLREIIETTEKKTLIDGVQSYLVKPIN